MNTLTDQDIDRLVQRWIKDALTLTDEARGVAGPYSTDLIAEELRDLEQYESSYREGLARRDYRAVMGRAEMLLNDEGYTVDKGSRDFKRFCRELTKAGVRHAQIEQKRSRGEYDADLPTVGTSEYDELASRVAGESLRHATGRSVRVQESDPAGDTGHILVSEAFEEFERESMTGKRWRDKTALENRAMVDAMKEVLGDIPLGSFDKTKARDYKAKLQKYPRNRRKDPRYRDKTLGQIQAMARVDTVSVTTVNNHLIKIASFFRWAVDQGYVADNPFTGLTIRTSHRAKESVLPFDKAELEAIFGSPVYSEGKYRKPWKFWLPLLGLFTGARIEELCQLHLEDIRKVDGIWCLDLNDKPGRSLKNKASKRLVPIHPELIRIGLAEFAETQRKARKTLLFPELGPVAGKRSHYPSIWFGKLKRDLGMPTRTKVFHSFRHLMADKLRAVRAHDHEIKAILGHETGSVTHDLYGGQEVKALSEVLSKADFGVDLSSIRFH